MVSVQFGPFVVGGFSCGLCSAISSSTVSHRVYLIVNTSSWGVYYGKEKGLPIY